MNKILCPRCCCRKPLDDFNKSRNRANGRQVYCKPCQSDNDQRHYRKHKARIAARKKAAGHRRYEKFVAFKKTKVCSECGNADFRVLDFHHCRGVKSFNISDFARQAISWKRLRAELKKCDCVCANCHRIITYESRKAQAD